LAGSSSNEEAGLGFVFEFKRNKQLQYKQDNSGTVNSSGVHKMHLENLWKTVIVRSSHI
jgi:hypothetical protein